MSKVYAVTSSKDGEPYIFNNPKMGEQTFNSLKKFFARYGVQLHGKVIGHESDKPLYRHATDEERAAGAPAIVKNTDGQDVI